MNTIAVFYLGVVLFLISVFGLFVSSDAVTVFISRQVMIAAVIMNFLNSPLQAAAQQHTVKTTLVLGLIVFYLLEFAVMFYIYSNSDSIGIFKGFNMLSLDKSDWWGEDRL